MDLGLDARKVWAAGFRLPQTGYDDERTRQTYRRLAPRDSPRLPGVESAALVDLAAARLGGRQQHAPSRAAGYQPAPGEPMSAGVSTVLSPAILKTLHIPILAGREFAERDDVKAPRAVGDQSVVRRALLCGGATRWGSSSTSGPTSGRWWALPKNGKYRSLNEARPQSFIYVCEPQVVDHSLAAVVPDDG